MDTTNTFLRVIAAEEEWRPSRAASSLDLEAACRRLWEDGKKAPIWDNRLVPAAGGLVEGYQ
jgi:hypothetical protein